MMALMGRRLLATFIFPLIITFALLAALLLLRSELPSEVASHWGISGEPDGFTSRDALPWISAGLVAAITLPAGLLIARTTPSIIAPRGISAIPATLAAFVSGLIMAATIPQIDLDATEVLSFRTPWWAIPVAVVSALVAAILAFTLTGRPDEAPTTSAPAEAGATRYPLDDGEVAVWSGETAKGWVLLALGLATFVGFAISAVLTNWWILVPATLVTGFMYAMSRFSVTAGPSGVRVVGIFGYPQITVPLSQIESAEAGVAKALKFGGWGLRKSFKGNDAVLTRSGPALVVSRTDGAKLHITLDDPASPASVISSLLDRRA